MYLYKHKGFIFGLLVLNGVLLCATILCSGTDFAHLLHLKQVAMYPRTTVTVISDHRSYVKGFIIKPFNNIDEGLCVAIVPKQFWEMGVYAHSLRNTLIRNLKITIDQQLLPQRFIDIGDGLLTDFSVMDAKGTVVGSYGAPMTACFVTDFLPTGCYDALVHEAKVSGITQEYAFQFCTGQPDMNSPF